MPSSILSFVKEADARQIGLHSFMLLRHGQVAAEARWAPYDPELPRMLFSLQELRFDGRRAGSGRRAARCR
ncbi:hypothetical protein [Paenibacillus solanacearum]|uniref:hypothetical protein n=1 Tax=Paenibacillus solanacearum TaxID=2048548 RepID=UPI001FEBFC60|nr:hypothetical protein [Paenibacillus solanacearum]